MSAPERSGASLEALFDGDEVREVLREGFYGAPRVRRVEPRLEPEPEAQPDASDRTLAPPAAAPPEARVPAAAPKPRRRRKRRAQRPTHYEVICISLYKEDLARLDAKVASLKESGHRKMSRSALIRYALDQVDLEGLPKAY